MSTKDLQEKTFEAAKDNFEDLEEKGSKLTEKVKDTAQEWQRQATEATRKAAKATDGYVRDNPWNAVAYVAIGCFVIGLLLGRSRD